MLFLLFLFFMCVGFPTHVWEFPNRWFFWRLFWGCSWRLILHVRLWNDRYRYNVVYQISKTQIQVQIQKVAPPVSKKTHMFGFYKHVCLFSTHLVFGKCLKKATHVWFLPLRKNTSWQYFFPHMFAFFQPLLGRLVECKFHTSVVFTKHLRLLPKRGMFKPNITYDWFVNDRMTQRSKKCAPTQKRCCFFGTFELYV